MHGSMALQAPAAPATDELLKDEGRVAHPHPLPLACALELVVRPEPEVLATVRHAVGGLAAALGFDHATVADVRLALSEVCSAAVLQGGDAITLRAALEGRALTVVVTGPKLTAGPPATAPVALPLPLVAALTSSLEVRSAGGATQVRMTFGG
jgi:anti-sigma regulatory factor (Ser/Thr protein kinase)